MVKNTAPINNDAGASSTPIVNPLAETPSAPVVATSASSAPVAPVVSTPVGTTTPAVKVKPEAKTVEVPVETLQQLLNRIESLEKVSKEHESTFDQDQMQKIERLRATGKLVQNVRLNYLDGKIVMSYKTLANDVYIDNTGKEQSSQTMRIVFEDNSDVVIPSVEFFRRRIQKSWEVIREARDNEGVLWKTLMLEGGREVTINAEYIN